MPVYTLFIRLSNGYGLVHNFSRILFKASLLEPRNSQFPMPTQSTSAQVYIDKLCSREMKAFPKSHDRHNPFEFYITENKNTV